MASAPVASTPWTVVVRQPESEAFGPARWLGARFLLSGLLFVAAALAFSLGAAYSITRPVWILTEAADGQEALERVTECSPDVVLLDVARPGLGGLEVAPEIVRRSPKSRILVLTQYENSEYVHRFLRMGVAGYLLKKAAGTELVSAIRAVHRGESFLDPSVAATVIRGYLDAGATVAEDPYESLTERERQVLKLVAEGQTSKEIARTLCISVKTVMAHRANLMAKLDVHNRSELIRFALRQGLIQADV